MKLILSNGKKLELPNELSITQRKQLVNQILETYPNDFTYGENKMFSNRYSVKQDNDHLVKIRLDVLGTYLIRGEPDYTETVMSSYKRQVRPQQEKPFSQFHQSVVEINGWH